MAHRLQRLPRIVLALALTCVVAPRVDARADPDAGAAQAEFDGLLARVRQSDESVDFLQLRRLYADSDDYRPFRDDAEESMIAAYGASDYEGALTIARDILGRNYMNIEAHFGGMLACDALGNAACSAHHAYVARGLIRSIAASGDGKAPATAYVVVSTPEEYALVRTLGVEVLSQALIREDDGHAYDVLTVRDRATGQQSKLYFNVDLALAATSRVFGLR
jgi:hypothetical protein